MTDTTKTPWNSFGRFLHHSWLGLIAMAALGRAGWCQDQDSPDKSGGNPEAQDEANKDKPTGTGEGTTGDPVEVSTGAFCYSKKLFEIPSRDLHLDLTLGYISNAQGIETQTGARWTHSYEEKLVVQYTVVDGPRRYDGPGDVLQWFEYNELEPDENLHALLIDVYHMHDLRVDHYTRNKYDPNDWIPDSGQLTKLKSTSHYSGPYVIPDSFVLRYADGHKTTFPASLSEGGCGIFTFRASEHRDKNGNKITFTYELDSKPVGCWPFGSNWYYRLHAAADDFGNHIDFAYDASDWLQTITAVTGSQSRAATLAHDSWGNITSITLPLVTQSPPGGPTVTFSPTAQFEYAPYNPTYPHSKHNIVRCFAPNEVAFAQAHATLPVPYVENTWDTTCERVLSQYVGGTNESGIPAGGTYAFRYEAYASPVSYADAYPAVSGWSPAFTCKYRTLTVDPDGHVELHCFDTSYRERLTYTFAGGLDPTAIGGTAIDSLVSISAASPAVTDHITTPSEAPLGSMLNGATCTYVLSAYNADNFVIAEYRPDSITLSTWDSGNTLDRYQHGNLLRRQKLSSTNPADKIEEAFAYEPLYNQVRARFDPRAFGSYTPPNGGTYTPQRYSVQTTFDYQSGPQSAIQGEASYWGVDLAQASSIAVLAGLNVQPITFGGGTAATAGNPVAVTREVRTYSSPMSGSPAFVSQLEVVQYAYNSFGLITLVTDPAGYKTRFSYYSPTASGPSIGSASSPGAGGLLASVVRAVDLTESQTVTVQYGYDVVGRTAVVRDERGFDTHFQYDQMDRAITETDAAGVAHGALFDQNGNQVQIVGTLQAPVMDPSTGMPTTAMTAARYVRTTMTYDILNNVLARQIQNGVSDPPSVVQYRYTRKGGRVLTLFPEWQNENKNVEASVFDEFGRPWTNTSGGITAQFATMGANALIPELASIPVDVPGVTATARTYYALSKTAQVVDAAGHATQYEYDGFNRRTKTVDSLGAYTALVLDKAGNTVETSAYSALNVLLAHSANLVDERNQAFEHQATHVDSSGVAVGDGIATTRQAFDIRGLEVETVNDAGSSWTKTYDGLGRTTTEHDPEQNVTVLGYDSSGNLIYREDTELESDSATTHVQRSWTFHDPVNRVTAEVDELGQATRFRYDTLGRLVCQTDARAAGAAVALASLDSSSHPQHVNLLSGPPVNPDGNTTWYEYDDAGYLLTTTVHQRVGGLGGNALLNGAASLIVSRRSYDLNGLLRTQTDDANNVTQYHYDALNRMDGTTYANQTIESRTYYANNLLKSRVDGNSTAVTYDYDTNNRLKRKNITPGPGVQGPTFVDYDYDALGRLTLANTPTWTISLAYDSLSQLVRETANGRVTRIGVDAVGRITGYQYPGGRRVEATHDAIGRLRMVKPPVGTTIATFEYRDTTSIKSTALANGTTASYQYDAVKRATTSSHASGATSIDSRQYAWDAQGNKTSRIDLMRSRTFVYNYDSSARMGSSTRSGASQPTETINYRLDDLGNRRSVSGGSDAGAYTLSSIDLPMNLYTSTPFDSRTYDDNQNVATQSGSVTMHYDYENHLVDYVDSAASRHHVYEYDALGRRVVKIVDQGSASQKTVRYYYDGGQRIIEEQDGAGATMATYVYGRGIDDVVSMKRAGTEYYYHADDMGNVVAISDSTGVVVESYEYKDYGQVADPSTMLPLAASSIGNVRLFSGRELDWETGLYHFRHRHMDPRSGRFMSRDPLGPWGDAGNSGNSQSYCGNNPWSRRDPLGLSGCSLEPPPPEPTDPKRGDCANSANGGDIKGDCGNSSNGGDIKGNCESHGSVSGKKGESGDRLSDAEYQKKKKKELAEDYKNAWQPQIDNIKKSKKEILDDKYHTGEPVDIDVEVTEDGNLKVTLKSPIYGTKSETYNPNNQSDMRNVDELIDKADNYNEGLVYNNKIRKEIFALGIGIGAGEALDLADKAKKVFSLDLPLGKLKSIADHAFGKHGGEFGFKSLEEMAQHIKSVCLNPSETKLLERGRRAFWDSATNSVVIVGKGGQGTCFKPKSGYDFYKKLQ